MEIAIIGTGNVGGALAGNWAKKGHQINLGVQDLDSFKGRDLLKNQNTRVFTIGESVARSEVLLIAIPPTAILDIIPHLGEAGGKVIIDSTNTVRNGPDPYKTVFHCLADKTSAELVKCFNSTGFENLIDPVYGGIAIDMFMAGDSKKAKLVASRLALDAGFESCIDFGGADKVELLEKLALSWINLAILQGHGRNMGFKVLRR